MKSEHVIVVFLVILAVATVLSWTGHNMDLFYAVMGEETYEIQLDVVLVPVDNGEGGLLDVDVQLSGVLKRVKVPHEVVGWRIYRDSSGMCLFDEGEGSFSLSLDIKVENFTSILLWRTEGLDSPEDYTSFTIYCFLEEAQPNSVLQLTVHASKHLVLNRLKDPVTKEWDYMEKWTIE